MHYSGQCHCGAVRFEAQGEPLSTQYCHCNKCRSVTKQSSNHNDKIGYAFTAAYLTKNFTILEIKDTLSSQIKNNSRLYLCLKCNSLIYGISEDPQKQEGIGININNFIFHDVLPNSFIPSQHI